MLFHTVALRSTLLIACDSPLQVGRGTTCVPQTPARTCDIHRSSPWMSSAACGTAAGLESPWLIRFLRREEGGRASLRAGPGEIK